MIETNKSERGGRTRLALWVALLLSTTACYGSHSVIFVDSVRGEGKRTIDDDLDSKRVPLSRCGPAGVSRVEVYSSWWDMFVSYLTFSSADRSAEITCAGEE